MTTRDCLPDCPPMSGQRWYLVVFGGLKRQFGRNVLKARRIRLFLRYKQLW